MALLVALSASTAMASSQDMKERDMMFMLSPACSIKPVQRFVVRIDEATTTVGEMRSKYAAGLNMSPDKIVFVHEGKTLTDDKALVKDVMDLTLNHGQVICKP